ncbi:Uncharacterized protein DBV15_03222 [Temnothorax longispinosus]|uniref:Uncharacterized protein n=1 Tax=Temnothorax longispinosus TaxID=300112 RepID=A0A4S2L9W0_9HYME|nr:Uncharacterized protein DBV15_03222 [Temnothorax longispinosus]
MRHKFDHNLESLLTKSDDKIALAKFFSFFRRLVCSPHQRDKQSASSDSAFCTLQRKKTRVPLYGPGELAVCSDQITEIGTWMATNGILLYTLKKPPNDDERAQDRIRNRLIGEKNARDNESRCLMVIPPLSAIDDDIATRVPDNEWTYCRSLIKKETVVYS